MTPVERLGLGLMRRIDPERAHHLSLRALNMGLAPMRPFASARLRTNLAGLSLPNPLGLAAGYDKNATALAPLARAGFGFLEVGAATPRPQPGNPKPRLFRLTEDRAAINRFGFNNDGADAIADRLAARPQGTIIGLNLGANKDSRDRAQDFAQVLGTTAKHIDFATVNVSSPNTERLRDLQGPEALRALLTGVMETRGKVKPDLPIFLKIAPDLTDSDLEDIANVARQAGIAAIIATNTTVDRTGLKSPQSAETGGLSGQPLFERATRVLAKLAHLTEGSIPLIGVGGIATTEDALQKLRAGATALQLYTSLVYTGLSRVGEINQGIDRHLQETGQTLEELTGSDIDRWL